jgi:hypothetical protein
MNYVRIESGSVVEQPRPLPENWLNISNFKILPNETLREYGWYPARFVPYIGPMENKVIIESTYELTETEWIEYQQVRDMTSDEINQFVEMEWQLIRSKRNILLLECDWTQLPDVSLEESKIVQWKEYRQKLRDITNVADPKLVVWPQIPS